VSKEDQGDNFALLVCNAIDTPPSMKCDSGLQTSDVDTDGKADHTNANRTEFMDGIFLEACALGTPCKVEPDGTNGCGSQASMCGAISCIQAISPLLAVEFDTWNNPGLYDPKQGLAKWWVNATMFTGYNDNHIAVFAADDVAGRGTSNNHAQSNHFGATPSVPAMADGQAHDVKIKYWASNPQGSRQLANKKARGVAYDASIPAQVDCQDNSAAANAHDRNAAPDHCYPSSVTNTEPGTLSIYIDNMQKPVLQVKITLLRPTKAYNLVDPDVDRHILDVNGNAYIGFSAATGGSRTGVMVNEDGQTQLAQADRSDSGYNQGANSNYQYVNEQAAQREGAAQYHEIIYFQFCNYIGCQAA